MCEALREFFKEELEQKFIAGEQSNQMTVVRNMINRGYDNDEIVAIAALSLAEVEAIRKTM